MQRVADLITGPMHKFAADKLSPAEVLKVGIQVAEALRSLKLRPRV